MLFTVLKIQCAAEVLQMTFEPSEYQEWEYSAGMAFLALSKFTYIFGVLNPLGLLYLG